MLLAMLCLGLGLALTGCAGTWSKIGQNVRQSWDAQRAYGEGLDRYEAGDYAGAIPLFRRALTLDPALDDAASRLAWSYYHSGRYSDASAQFKRTIARRPAWEGLYNGLGWSRYQAGRYHIAAQSFQRALELDPNYRYAAVGFAYSLFERGRYAEALPHLDRLRREGGGSLLGNREPDLDAVRSRLAWTLFYLRDYAKAREQFTKGVAARPDWYGLHNGLGWCYLKLGDKARARASFTRALQLKPDLGDAKEGLSRASG